MNYIITVTPLNGDSSWSITTDDNITSYTVTGLMVGLTYTFLFKLITLSEKVTLVTMLLPLLVKVSDLVILLL